MECLGIVSSLQDTSSSVRIDGENRKKHSQPSGSAIWWGVSCGVVRRNCVLENLRVALKISYHRPKGLGLKIGDLQEGHVFLLIQINIKAIYVA